MVERVPDNGKKHPLLVIGELPFALPGAIPLPLSAVGAPDSLPIHDFYLVLAVPEAETHAALARLEEFRVSPAQILVFLPAGIPFQHPRLAFLGLIEAVEGESSEDFRARVHSKLEAQRQKKLCYALQEALDSGLSRRRSEADFSRALDACRIAHTLACGYALSPLSHARVLRTVLEKETLSPDPWPNDISLERLIVEASLLLLECHGRGNGFREAFKEKSVVLPFRARNDLLLHIETRLAFLTGGRSHAA